MTALSSNYATVRGHGTEKRKPPRRELVQNAFDDTMI